MQSNKSIAFNIKILLYFNILFITIFTILNAYSFFIMTNNQDRLINKVLPTIYEMNTLKNNMGSIEKDLREGILTKEAFVLEKLQNSLHQNIFETKKLLAQKKNKQFNVLNNQISEIQKIVDRFLVLKKENIKRQKKRENYLESLNIIYSSLETQTNARYNKILILLITAINENNYIKVKKLHKNFLSIQKSSTDKIIDLDYNNLFYNQMELIKEEYKLKKIILRFVQIELLSLEIKKINDILLSKEQTDALDFEKRFYSLNTYLFIAFLFSLLIFTLFINYVQKISKRMSTLKSKMSEYVKGNRVEIVIDIDDEIGTIAKSFMHFVNIVLLREDELRMEQQKAVGATKIKSKFLANMSHEIRTPLNAIINMNYFISQTKLTTEQYNLVNKIKNASNSLLNIIDDILDFSKIEAGKLEIEKINFDINQLLSNVITIVEIKAQEKGLYFEITKKIDDEVFYGDPFRIEQILINLINNAIKFTHKGSIEIYIEQKNNDLVRFNVKDTGIGISQSNLQKLFKSFSQADGSTTRKYGGSGLGLTISKQLVELMDGSIGVDSKKGVGSLFYFELVLQKGDENKIEKTIRQELLPYTNAELEKLKNSNILLVEDNEINIEIIERFLSFSGVIIENAFNGQDAVDIYKLNPNKYDLILMDIQMPIMDGIEATKIIKSINPDAIIIALTADVMKEDIEKTKEVGMVGYLKKPLDSNDFLNTVLKYISISKENMNVLDYDLGLSYLMNDNKLYQKILNDFYMKYKDLDWNSLNEKELLIVLHTLNSLSENIGAIKLHNVVEKIYKTKNFNHLKSIDIELQKVLQEIKSQ